MRMLAPMELTTFEREVWQKLFELHGSEGFPPSSEIKVLARRNTGAGRFVDLSAEPSMGDYSGFLDLSGEVHMEGVDAGLGVVVAVEAGRPVELEFYINGLAVWDGSETHWTFD